jgi:hypothetical protein
MYKVTTLAKLIIIIIIMLNIEYFPTIDQSFKKGQTAYHYPKRLTRPWMVGPF